MTTTAPLALVPLLAGYLLAGALRAGSTRPSRSLRLSLAFGWAAGMASCVYFAWLILAGRPGRAYVATDAALFAVLGIVGAVAGRARGVPWPAEAGQGVWPKVVVVVLGAVAIAMAGLGVAFFVALTLNTPHGRWDATAVWNLRARFLTRGGDDWAEAFHPLLAHSHLDYPLLVPLSVARLWTYLDNESTWAPAALALGFTLATWGLLVSALAALRGRTQGLIGGIALLATPQLFEHGSYQFADVPLAYYFLATLAAQALGDRAEGDPLRWKVAAGMMAGFAAWTKNEGLLFLAAVIAVRLVAVVATRGRRAYLREAAGFALGLAPAFAALVYFKLRFSPSSELLAGLTSGTLLAKLADPSRYGLVIRAVASESIQWGSGLLAALAAYRLLLGGAPRPAVAGRGLPAAVVLALVLAGYFFVYITTPHYLPWHLQWSLTRLALHVWPSAVFALLLGTATPAEALARARAKPEAQGHADQPR
jgi:hypothetical protein